MKFVVAALRPTPILWRRASALESPTEVPASTLPALGMAPVRARMASRSVVLPLWKGPTSAMHRGPRGLLASCPIAASRSGARPVIVAAALMVSGVLRLGKREKRRPCPGRAAAFFTLLRRAGTVANAGVRYGPGSAAHRFARATRCAASGERLSSRPQFQAFQPGGDIDADLALDAQ